jgi:hypothetical protein
LSKAWCVMTDQVRRDTNEFSPEELLAIANISSELSKLSNKKAKEVLTMLSSIRGLRIVSMDRPIGLPQDKPKPMTSRGVRGPGPRPKRASWKSDPGWVRMEKLHTDLVSAIKTESNPEGKARLVADLRNLESEMKSLKLSLLGFHPPA